MDRFVKFSDNDRDPAAPVLTRTIRGPATWTKDKEYTFTITITFEQHAGEDNRPITIMDSPQEGVGMFGEGFALVHHSQNGLKEIDLEDMCQVMVVENSEPRDIPVSSDCGFRTLYPGQSITEECDLSQEWDYNLYGINIAEKLTYLFQGKVVQWWDYGTLEDHANTKIWSTATSHDERPKIVIPSTSIEIELKE